MEFTNLASFERLTGMFFFKETGAASFLPFGNILSIAVDTGAQEGDTLIFKRGHGVLARKDLYAVKPVLKVKTNQCATSVMALLMMGDRASDSVQASGSGSTFMFTAAKGQAYDIGARDVTITTVQVSAVT